ncbi:hypothetical protein GH714_009382 [Hevea brasiliensis]|uniref:Legumain prodomain domain-containing protein n=1 Tax=Hevea brasiliensis TaxID=3981 RepID=A0A6A6MHD6_HEVBR|nr:hypothetical protein GH714_009382 [Hevea brasiliensis]
MSLQDYTGEHVTAKNLYAVLLGDKSAVKGGSGKVVNSKANDRIFLYYTDHGGPGVLGMPNPPFVYAMDFIEVLKKKQAAGGYKEMVKARTSNCNTYNAGSHVMEYGNTSIKAERVYLYQGFDPASVNFPPKNGHISAPMDVVNQRDAELLFMWQMYKRSKDGSEKKTQILQQVTETIKHRKHLDSSIELIGTLLFGPQKSSSILHSVRGPGLPLVDDWNCLKSMVRVFETHCGSLTQYGMKHMRAFANICNTGVSQVSMEEAATAMCNGLDVGQWHPSNQGYSA